MAAEDTPPPSEENPYATFWRRGWAFILDSLIFQLPLLFATLHRTPFPPAVEMVVIYAGILGPAAYQVVLHRYGGQTLGKALMGVRVVSTIPGATALSPLRWRQAVLRSIMPLLLYIPAMITGLRYAGLGVPPELVRSLEIMHLGPWKAYPEWLFLMAWFGLELSAVATLPHRRAVHDLLAKTEVIRVQSELRHRAAAVLFSAAGVLLAAEYQTRFSARIARERRDIQAEATNAAEAGRFGDAIQLKYLLLLAASPEQQGAIAFEIADHLERLHLPEEAGAIRRLPWTRTQTSSASAMEPGRPSSGQDPSP